MRGRKKIPRCISFDTDTLICSCRGPIGVDKEQLKKRPKIILTRDELQVLVDKDIDKKTMDEGCGCMGVSKTVYAGIYTSAREKVTQSIIQGAVLMIECKK